MDLDSGSVREGELIDLKEVGPVKLDAELSSVGETLYRGRIGDADLLILKFRLSVTRPKRGIYEVVTLGYVSKVQGAEVAVIFESCPGAPCC
jgi:hypothetical protein